MNSNQRKAANIFKEFLDKAILPEIRRNDSLSASCQYFINILGQDPLDLVGLQAIADSFSANRQPTQQDNTKVQAPFAFVKRKQEISNSYDYLSEPSSGFNPSRTFGGERSRYNIYQPKKPETPTEGSHHSSSDFKPQISGQPTRTLINLENIYRVFMENQQKLEQMSQQGLIQGGYSANRGRGE